MAESRESTILDVKLDAGKVAQDLQDLIQHTNFIDNIDENGRVTPNKVLTIEREDSFETYESLSSCLQNRDLKWTGPGESLRILMRQG